MMCADFMIAVRDTYGQRFVHRERATRGLDGQDLVQVWDFNPYTASKREQGGMRDILKGLLPTRLGPSKRVSVTLKKETEDATDYESKVSIIKDKDVFEDGYVTSSLPYRRATCKGRFPRMTGVMLDEERVLAWSVSELRLGFQDITNH